MGYIHSEDVPNIDLYMDQVTTFLDERLKHSSRYLRDEKLMTKTMINNYAKNDVIPPPVKKKYTKDHMLMLIFLFYFKSFLQISDIKELMDPLLKGIGEEDCEYGMEEIYNEIFKNVGEQLPSIEDDVIEKFKDSQDMFKDAPKESADYLKLFSYVCMLGCDIFVKKLLVEKIIDSMRENQGEPGSKESEGSKGSAKTDKKASKGERKN